MAECFSKRDAGRSAARRACRCIGVGARDEGSVLPKEKNCTTRTPRDPPHRPAPGAPPFPPPSPPPDAPAEIATLLPELLVAERRRGGPGVGARAASAR